MSNEKKFFRCNVCGNIVGLIREGGGELVCCGQPMELLIPNTSDGATEKHVPVARREGGKLVVDIGSAPHPMIPEHYIMWIAVSQGNRMQRVSLNPGEAPQAVFEIADGPATIYEYCNLHSLWKAEI
jgi:superoxide reductase